MAKDKDSVDNKDMVPQEYQVAAQVQAPTRLIRAIWIWIVRHPAKDMD